VAARDRQRKHESLVSVAIGKPDPHAPPEQPKSIATLLDDFERFLRAKRDAGDYVDQAIRRIERLVEVAGRTTVADIDADQAVIALGKLTDERTKKLLAANTRNAYLVSAKAFCEWLTPKHLPTNPLDKLEKLNAEKDRRRIRRALTVGEFGRIVSAAKAGPTVAGTTGSKRALAYICAAYFGHRRGSLQSLRRCDFDMSGMMVILPANKAKGGKTTPPTPLHPGIIPAITKALEGLGPEDQLLSGLTKHVSCGGFKLDLAAAGVPRLDARGRVADMACLRMTFCTRLKEGGVGLVDAQRLMHHSTSALTSNAYTDMTLDTARAAINRLPAPPSLD
jgi:integrase